MSAAADAPFAVPSLHLLACGSPTRVYAPRPGALHTCQQRAAAPLALAQTGLQGEQQLVKPFACFVQAVMSKAMYTSLRGETGIPPGRALCC